jgi:hypothetical protein
MRFGRAIIIPAILALGAAGSILVGSVPVAAAQAPAAHMHSATSSMRPLIRYHT